MQLPGIKDPEQAIELVGRTTQLQFKLVDPEPVPELGTRLEAAVRSGRLENNYSQRDPNQAIREVIPASDELYLEKRVDRESGTVKTIPALVKQVSLMTGEAIHTARMAEKNLLYEVIKAFSRIDLSLERVDSMQMGYVFEELIRIGAEQSNEEAGEHFTPREVIKLMVNLLLSPEKVLGRSHVVKTIYDPACGTGGMLSVSENYILALNDQANPLLFGQDWNDEAWAVCKTVCFFDRSRKRPAKTIRSSRRPWLTLWTSSCWESAN